MISPTTSAPDLTYCKNCLLQSIFIATTLVQVTIILNLLLIFYFPFAEPGPSASLSTAENNHLNMW